MRVLYVTEGFPYPLTSGNLRHYHLIRGLSERHEIHLVSAVGQSHLPEHVDGMRGFCSEVETFRSTAGSSLVRKLSSSVRDLVVAGGSSATARAMASAVAEPLARGAYDVVVLTGRLTATMLDIAGRTPVVVDLCDAAVPRLRAALRYSTPSQRALVRIQLRRVQRAESRMIAGGSHLLFASARDRASTLRGAAAPPPATILPNGVDLDYWRRTQPRLGGDVVFSGAMQYPPNDDASRFLLGTVMPHVWNAQPQLRLRLIGINPTRALLRAAEGEPRVTVTGFVEDVRPHLEQGAVYAAPLRFASGIQNKLLEALAMELPIITSDQGANGLRGEHAAQLPLVVAESADEFASEILSAVDRARTNPEPHRAGRDFVAEHFTWSEAIATLERVLDATVRQA
jgi:glycosyltransferase involved in cell wall biosynthesis